VHSAQIEAVLSAVREKYGRDALTYYGCDEGEAHGACFRVWSVPASISIHTQEGALPDGQYDVQVESIPPGDYILSSVVGLEALLGLVEQLRQPTDKWPMSVA
jgi:hypothetical protein